MREWQRAWEGEIKEREPEAWEAYQETYGPNGTFREWVVFLTGWRLALKKLAEELI